MKIITVAIASYNNSTYIERCIESVLKQSFKDFNVIIVDDGSTDNTKEVCKKYTNNDLIQFIEKENGGLSSVRQKAIEVCDTPYICFIDGDDYLEEFYLENLFNAIKRQDADLAICNTNFLNGEGNAIESPPDYSTYNCDEDLIIDLKIIQEKFSYLASKLTLSDSWNKIYKVSFIKNNNLCFDLTKGYNGSDLLFNHKLIFYMPKIAFTSYFGYDHLMYNSSAVHRKNRKLFYGFSEIYRKIEEESLKSNLSDKILMPLCNLYLTMMRDGYLDAITGSHNESKTKILKGIISEAKLNEEKLIISRCKKWKIEKRSLSFFRKIMFKPLFCYLYLKVLKFRAN